MTPFCHNPQTLSLCIRMENFLRWKATITPLTTASTAYKHKKMPPHQTLHIRENVKSILFICEAR